MAQHCMLAWCLCKYSKFKKILQIFYFGETSRTQSFVKIKPSRNDEITPSFTDVGKSCPIREFITLQICILTLIMNINFSRKLLNLYSS